MILHYITRPLFYLKNKHLTQRQFFLLLSFIVGLFSALAACFLKWLIHIIEIILTQQFDRTEEHWLYLIYPIVGIVLTVLFVKYVVHDDISHGITKILFALSRKQGHLQKHNCWSSVIASSLTIGFGGSVGAESPIVLTGSAIGSNLGSLFKLEHRALMLLVGCGASGAIAGIFKAPIAGVVFTLEVLMVDLTMASLLPLLIASLTATCTAYALTGMGAMFEFHMNESFAIRQIPSTILLGIGCGLLSLYFTRVTNRVENFFRRINQIWIRIAIGGTLLAFLIFLFPPLYGEGYNTINVVLNASNPSDFNALLNNSIFYGESHNLLLFIGAIILLKAFASTATNASGGCGGLFAPSLFLGCLGGLFFSAVWNDFHILHTELPNHNYALLGMAGIMSGVFHAPLTGVFLIAELTGGYDLFIPLMIVSTASYLVIHIFEPHSIYAMRLARHGDLLTHNTDQSVLTLMSLDAVIDKTIPRLAPEMDLGQIVKIVSDKSQDDFAVTDGEGMLLGIINLHAIRLYIFRNELYHEFVAAQLMQKPASLLYTDDTMQSVMDKFQETDADVLPVVKSDQTFVGFISRAKAYGLYRQLVIDFSQE
ncbi:MAG: chloride channel protein [Alloprevotella sp.]|nr:chloride channel protein [Alloprevotella sp.]